MIPYGQSPYISATSLYLLDMSVDRSHAYRSHNNTYAHAQDNNMQLSNDASEMEIE